MNSEVDVNVLVRNYHRRLSEVINQNVLLESKLESLAQDYAQLQKVVQDLQEENDDETSNENWGRVMVGHAVSGRSQLKDTV